MGRLDTLERRLGEVERLTKAKDAPAMVARELRALGADVRDRAHAGGVVVVESHASDPPDLREGIDRTLRKLDAEGYCSDVTVVVIDHLGPREGVISAAIVESPAGGPPTVFWDSKVSARGTVRTGLTPHNRKETSRDDR